tara:strand:- start:7695 stop:8852 length:1158 start_codon:yes stop_codon:yes gene_type:complete
MVKFKEIEGNEKAKEYLINSVKNNRISHSHLFLGKAGTSKLLLSLAYAQYISCLNRLDKDSCGECSSCIKYSKLTHPDLHLIFPVISTNNIKKPISDNFINEWRQLVLDNPFLNISHWANFLHQEKGSLKTPYIYTQESDKLQKKISLKNYESKYRVILIWMPEKFQITTSNKLLKIIEEPPRNNIFILVSENTESILDTILSRVQLTKIKDFTCQQKIKILNNKFTEENTETISEIINNNHGDLGDSINFINKKSNNISYMNYFMEWMRLCYSTNLYETKLWVDKLYTQGRNCHIELLKYSLETIRKCLVFKYKDVKINNINKQELDFIKKFHIFIHQGNIYKIVKGLEDSIGYIERNANSKIIFYELSIQFMRWLKLKLDEKK